MSFQIVEVKAQSDHFTTLAGTKKPLIAVQELIWNSLDADADNVRVNFKWNPLGGLDEIKVSDYGTGIPHDEGLATFSKLGGSWKKLTTTSKLKDRALHGRLGKGRFRAFSLGKFVKWETVYKSDDAKNMQYTIEGNTSNLGTFKISNPVEVDKPVGTMVTIMWNRTELSFIIRR